MGTTPPSPQPVQPDKPLYKWIARVLLTLVGIGFFLLFLLLLKKVGNFSSPQDTVNLFLSFGSLYLAFVMWIGTLKEWEVPYQKAYRLVYKIVEFFMRWFKLNFDWLHTNLPWGRPGKVLPKGKIWNCPKVASKNFTGQQEFLKGIERTFQDDDGHIQVIGGIKGIGKSRVAYQYARLYKGNTYQTVLWITASSLQAFEASCQTIAKEAVQGQQTPTAQAAVGIVLRWLSSNSDWLLVFDNCRIPENDLVHQCLAFNDARRHILITTDLSEAAFHLRNYKSLPCLNEEEAASLLLSCCSPQKHHVTEEERKQAIKIVQVLGCLPLALIHAAHYRPLEDFPDLYTPEAHKFFTHQPKIPLHLHFFNTEHWTLKETWQETYTTITQSPQQGGAELLKYCAFFSPGQPIEEKLITEILHPQQGGNHLNDLKKPLEEFSLIDIIDGQLGKSLSLHSVLQAVVRQGTYDGGIQALESYAKKVVQTINNSFPKAIFPHWQQCSRLLSQALTCYQHIETHELNTPDAIQLLYNTGCFLLECANYKEAEKLLEKALQIKKKNYADENYVDDLQHPSLMNIQLTLGELYHKQALLLRAEGYYQAARGTLAYDPYVVQELLADLDNTPQVKEGLTRHLLQSIILTHQGQVQDDRRHYPLATDLYKQALDICNEALDKGQQALDNRKQQLQAYKTTLARDEQNLRAMPISIDRPTRLAQINTLNTEIAGKQSSITVLEPQIKLLQEQNTELQIQKAIILNNKAFLYMRLVEFQESEEQAKKALLTALTLATEDDAEKMAKELFSQALGIFTKELDEGDINMLICRTHLAKLHIIKLIQSKSGELTPPITFHIDVSYPEGTTEKEYQDIDACFQNLLNVDDNTIGANHPLRASCYNDLGLFHAMLSNISGAMNDLLHAESIYSAINSHHPMLAIIKKNRALLYEKTSKDDSNYSEADSLWRQANDIDQAFEADNLAEH